MDKLAFTRFISGLRPGERVFIQTHDFPDQDAISSAYGLKRILESFGISATMCYRGNLNNDAISYILNAYGIPVLEISQIPNMSMADKIILVDGQKMNRNMTDLPGDEVACIDHHQDNEKVEFAYEDIRPCGACASIIAEYFRALEIPLDNKAATLLLYGVQMDTDNFRRGVTELDIEAFRQLFPLADADMLRKLAGRTMRQKDLRAFGTAIDTVKLYDNLGIAFIPFACDDYIIAQVADFMLALAEVDTAIVYSRRVEGLKFSARTLLPSVNCDKLLQTCLRPEGGNGGGHPHMAGGFLPRQKVSALYEAGLSWEEWRYNVIDFQEHMAERAVKLVCGKKDNRE